MTAKQSTGLQAPDGSNYVTLTDGAGNLAPASGGTVSENLTQVGGAAIALGQTTASASLPVVLASNQTPVSTIGAEIATDTTGTFTNGTQTTSITANGLDGYGTALVSINGTYGTATAVFEISDDAGTTWYPVLANQTGASVTENGYTSLTNTSRAWVIPVSGADSFRVRSTAVASGTVNVRVSISSAVPPSSSVITGSVSINTSGTGTQSSVASSATDVTILAANTSRKGAAVYNDSTAILYLLVGSGTSSTSLYTVQVSPSAYYEIPYNYVGILKGIWASANGNARVTEFS